MTILSPTTRHRHWIDRVASTTAILKVFIAFVKSDSWGSPDRAETPYPHRPPEFRAIRETVIVLFWDHSIPIRAKSARHQLSFMRHWDQVRGERVLKTKYHIMPLATLFLSVLIIGLAPSVSQAITCTVGALTNPPGATVNSSTLCGAGTGNNNTGSGNPGAVQLNSLAVGGSTTWAEITTLQQGSGSNNSFYFTGTKSGNFDINTNILSYSEFVLVLKDGNSLINPNGPPNSVGWAWFLLGGSNPIACQTGFDVCGNWSMWGNPNSNGNLVDLSHMSLYGTGTGAQLPVPSTLFLLGFGLIVLAVMAREKGSAQNVFWPTGSGRG